MEKEEFKPKINFICTIPRSLSTILYRSLLENENCICLFECFLHYEVRNAYENLKNKYKDVNDLYKIIENSIEAATKSKKDVLIKDFASTICLHYEFIDNLKKSYDVKFIYLIRHPKPCLFSLFKSLDNDKDYDQTLYDDKIFDFYKVCWECYQRYKGDIFFSDDLLEFPEITLKKILEYLGWDISLKYFEYKRLIDVGIPEYFKVLPSIWYESALYSTKIEQKKTDLDFEIKDELLLKMIDQAMINYQKFVIESKNVSS